jgi:hypothetical protein
MRRSYAPTPKTHRTRLTEVLAGRMPGARSTRFAPLRAPCTRGATFLKQRGTLQVGARGSWPRQCPGVFPLLIVSNWPRALGRKARGQLLALKSPAVAPAGGLLTEPVLEPPSVLPIARADKAALLRPASP